MSKQMVREILAMLDRGFLPYDGEVEESVYVRLRCPSPARAAWFQHEGKTWLCLGCKRRCVTADSAGFQLLLATRYPVRLAFADLPLVTAEELLRCKTLLRPDEAMFCLGGISRRKFDYMVDSGILERHPALPVRVTAESVKMEMRKSG
ncbi:MAG: DNA-binding protein [Proteobacteria bacterium]|nr:DNA-binding protein [Pseudomonadota bacterium]